VLIQRPADATVSVTKAARLLGVHPNTVRAWSDQGRLRYYRINPRGDRRYRLGDLQRFLEAAEIDPDEASDHGPDVGHPTRPEHGKVVHLRDRAGTRRGADWPRDPIGGVARSDRARIAEAGRSASARRSDEDAAAAADLARMSLWAAQLQSIQQLGSRLNRLTVASDIGNAIATELRDLIDYHNVRVYRIDGSDLVPVAFRGQVGEYVDETPDQLRIGVGQGITGWVAANRIAQNLGDAAADPRAQTIPGTDDDMAESMLLAPMVFDDHVLGVLVLSKLGLDQFSDDDLRLLEIYASFAAQAFANADSTQLLRERSASLERQLRSQRELLQITESILTTLDPTAVLDQITDRLGNLVAYDNISIELYDRRANVLTPLTARGVNAADYLEPWQPGEVGLATWVLHHNEPQLVVDELADTRVQQFESTGPVEGSLIVVPLRGRAGVTGVLTLERLGTDDRFDEEDFELVKLFSAQVSIALHNAETHRDVEIRARSDDLTGLLNHGTFQAWLAQRVHEGATFSLIMLDLDDFRNVNNELGHQAGDRLLRAIADALLNAGRDSDHVFRYGGDEFTFLLPGTDGRGALRVAERAREAVLRVASHGEWATSRTRVSASIGVATFPVDGRLPETVLLAADRACFVAKRTGRDRIATADEGLTLASEFALQEPTPVDPPSVEIERD
jgi:diguanylate cyclase (GGDEF)-like protein/excisionase family DNA binding protein